MDSFIEIYYIHFQQANKPLQGMAPTESLLSAFVLDCFLACLPPHLLTSSLALLAFSPASCLPAC